jgi:hypothetical protein
MNEALEQIDLKDANFIRLAEKIQRIRNCLQILRNKVLNNKCWTYKTMVFPLRELDIDNIEEELDNMIEECINNNLV